jgi:DNA polymerase elongation subunit (family B)
LIARAARQSVSLSIGRDGTDFNAHPDSLKVGALSEGFTRYTLAGREIIDTLHAVKRYDAVARDMRRHGLKHAARYFGLATEDREYVEGPQIAAIFRAEPDRVRRYALDDVREVDELSRKLLGATFMLASMVPKPYERVATSGTGQGLIEPLLVRAYITAGYSVPAGGEGQPYEGGATAIFTSGVLSHVVKADIASLYPSIMRTFRITARSDRHVGAILTLLDHLMDERLRHKGLARDLPRDHPMRAYHDALQGAVKILINSFYGSLGNPMNLFADVEAAAQITRRGREILFQMLDLFERRGVRLIEADTDGVYFSVPDDWTAAQELALVREVSEALPAGITIEHDGRWRRMYSYMEKNYALIGYDGSLLIKGSSFRSSRNEPYGERFFRAVLPLIMDGKMAEARALYLDTIEHLRSHALPVEDVCVNTQLTKSPEAYRQSRRKEEPYEVMLQAKRSWESGQRIAFYQATRGRKKLLDDAADDYDAEVYVAKLSTTFA